MKSKTLIQLLISLLIGCFVILLWFLPFGERFELGVLNYWFLIRGKLEQPKDIVIVAMDEVSYRDLKVPLNQAWPRKLHAQLLNRLAEHGASRVIFDVLFLDASADAKADQDLAKAISRLPVFLGAEATVQQVGGTSGSFALEELLEPYAPLAKNAAGLALVALPEHDGAIRGFLVERGEVSSHLPSLAEVGAGLMPEDGKPRPSSRDLINYFGPARTLNTLSYYQVLQTERPLPSSMFKDKIVYVGLALRTDTGPAQKDVFTTSYGGARIFGTEIHATAAANLMQQNWIKRLPSVVEQGLEFLLAIVIGYFLISLTPSAGALLIGFTIVLWGIVSFVSFRYGLFIPGGLLTLVVLPIAFLGSTLYYYFVAQQSARQMKTAFELYLSPEMAAQLSRSDSTTALGGTKTFATAMFTDIADFTRITEEMPAEKVAEMLNAYFTEVMEVVFQNKGTLIKFIGDAVFVLWGAPVRIDNHAELALQTAIELDREVQRFNKSARFPALRTRIGINTGSMVVGNLGSKRRFDYTAIGDSVNLASRTEGLNKYFGTTILFTEATRKEVGNTINAIEVGAVRVQGKREAVMMYTLLDATQSGEINQICADLLSDFRARRWAAVIEKTKKMSELEPRLRGVAQLYRELVENFEVTPPPSGWNGEIDFVHK